MDLKFRRLASGETAVFQLSRKIYNKSNLFNLFIHRHVLLKRSLVGGKRILLLSSCSFLLLVTVRYP